MNKILLNRCLIKCWLTRSEHMIKEWLADAVQKWVMILWKFYQRKLSKYI